MPELLAAILYRMAHATTELELELAHILLQDALQEARS